MPKDMSLLEKDGAPTEEELKEFFRKHDFSSQVSSFDVNTASESENRLYIRATKIFRGSWNDQVYALGGKKTLRNFSKNDPLRCLEDSEEKLVSGTVAEIASDEDLFQSIIDSVFSSFQNELYASALKLAEQNGKTIDDLTDEEIALVIDSFSDELLASMMGKLLLTQSVPEILGVLKTDRAHEDYNPSVRENHDQIDFIINNSFRFCCDLISEEHFNESFCPPPSFSGLKMALRILNDIRSSKCSKRVSKNQTVLQQKKSTPKRASVSI